MFRDLEQHPNSEVAADLPLLNNTAQKTHTPCCYAQKFT